MVFQIIFLQQLLHQLLPEQGLDSLCLILEMVALTLGILIVNILVPSRYFIRGIDW